MVVFRDTPPDAPDTLAACFAAVVRDGHERQRLAYERLARAGCGTIEAERDAVRECCRDAIVSGKTKARLYGVMLIRYCANAECLVPLIDLLDHRTAFVRDEAALALFALTGAASHTDANWWRAWWAANRATWRPPVPREYA